MKTVVIVAFAFLCKIEDKSCCLFAADHRLVYLRPVVEDDNTYINAVSVHVSHLFLQTTAYSKCAKNTILHITANWLLSEEYFIWRTEKLVFIIIIIIVIMEKTEAA